MKKRVIVLDTNVLLHDPESPLHFANENVVIPIQVVEEVDRFKRDPGEKGRNARRVSRLLDSLREKGNLSSGCLLYTSPSPRDLSTSRMPSSA